MKAWWTKSVRGFFGRQFRRLSIGVTFGSLVGVVVHLLTRDSVFYPAIRLKWASFAFHKQFDGFRAYNIEFWGLIIGLSMLALVPWILWSWRYLRAWWTGIASVTTLVSAAVTVVVLSYGTAQTKTTIALAFIAVCAVIALEYWRHNALPAHPAVSELKLEIPDRKSKTAAEYRWEALSSDDPIHEWDEDIVGRAAVVEALAEHALRLRTPIVALHGGLGDGKSSVLNLFRKAVEKRAVVVSFSAWLPGSEETFAADLFRDIATECKKIIHVPQLRKQALAYARTLSGSVSYLGGLKEILPAQSQRQEIDELRETLMRVPSPILVLLDEVDRMQKEEVLVLLKILRGVASIRNITFVCAFSEKEMRKLSDDGGWSHDYLEKFFPVTINLAAPDAGMLGRLFQDRLKNSFREQNWFPTPEGETKFSELLERVWNESLSRVCTNLRKIGLLFNDIRSAARPITGEVNAFDLTVIEAVRRFYPEVYRIIRTNPLFTTYATSNWKKGRYFTEEEKERGAKEFFKNLDTVISKSNEPAAVEAMLSWIFPDFAKAKTKGLTFYGLSRPTSQEVAASEKRICDPDYFPIYFRAAVAEEMFSNAELRRLVSDLTEAKTESSVESVVSQALKGVPSNHPKREDFLWKLGGALGL